MQVMSAAPLSGVRTGRRSPLRLPAVSLLTVTLLAGACKGGAQQTASPTGATTPPSTIPPTSPSPSVTPPTGPAALIASLPVSCDQGVPAASASITFAADGRGWAVAPDGDGLTCLFDVGNPGLFAWGPKADRVVLAGLEVRGVGSDASRPPKDLEPADASWGRPTGLALAFVDSTAKKLEKALIGGSRIQNVSPFNNVTYQHVVYHPSGLALGFVLTDSDGSSIWLSSNTGKDPKKLVFSDQGTVFGPIAFDQDGTGLFYGAAVADGSTMVSVLELKSNTVTEGLWKGDRGILRIIPQAEASGLLVDAGSNCADSQALFSTQDGTDGTPLLPQATGPTTAIGWLDDHLALVGEGGCGEPMRLWAVDTTIGGAATLLVEGVDRASVRVPDPLPTPPLPDIGVNAGVG
jgi:hypothetical protein